MKYKQGRGISNVNRDMTQEPKQVKWGEGERPGEGPRNGARLCGKHQPAAPLPTAKECSGSKTMAVVATAVRHMR